MKTYNVFYNNLLIGKLYTTETQHKYDCLINETFDKAITNCILSVAKNSQDWGEKIHFFESKIINASRFEKVSKISSHGDNYTLIEAN